MLREAGGGVNREVNVSQCQLRPHAGPGRGPGWTRLRGPLPQNCVRHLSALVPGAPFSLVTTCWGLSREAEVGTPHGLLGPPALTSSGAGLPAAAYYPPGPPSPPPHREGEDEICLFTVLSPELSAVPGA